MGCVQSYKYQPYCPNCNSNENVIEIVYAGSGAGKRLGESFVELTVTLQHHDSGFGFRIVGGNEEGSQVIF